MTADDFRRLALSFPETVESPHMEHPDFRRVLNAAWRNIAPKKLVAEQAWAVFDKWSAAKPSDPVRGPNFTER